MRKKITQQAHRALLTGLRAVQEDEGDGFAIRLLLCYPYFENPAAGRRQVCLENPQAAACIQKEGDVYKRQVYLPSERIRKNSG